MTSSIARIAPKQVEVSVDISWTGDLPVIYTQRQPEAPAKPAVDQTQIAGVERPAFERFDLPPKRVGATVWKKLGAQPTAGFVTNASVTGMWIETDGALPLRTDVTVELVVPGGYSAVLAGRVVRSNDEGMAVHLQTEDSTWQFRSSFLELAKREDGEAPQVAIKRGAPEEITDVASREQDLRVLGAQWHEVLADITDEDAHQTFIQACVERKRLEFALERYRELQEGPNAELAEQFLNQIGVILGFMGLQKEEAKKEDRQGLIKMALLVIIVLGAFFVLQQLFVAKFGAPEPKREPMRIQADPVAPPPAAVKEAAPAPEEASPPLEESDQGLGPLWDAPPG